MKRRQVAFTLRFDPQLYQRVKTACRLEGRSVTAFVQEAVSRKLAEQETAAFFDAFSLVGEAADEASIEFALAAQREVVSSDD